MRAYSQDLRRRILRAVDQGQPRAEIIETFAVSRSTIKRYLKLRCATGDVKPRAIPGRTSKKGAALQAGLLPQLEAHPDATLVEHCQIWKSAHGVQVSSATMSRAIHYLKWTRKKKTIRASEQNEADRAAWREHAKTLDESLLVFIDECGSNIALTRLYARSPKGKRVYGAVPRNRRANMTLIAALSLQGMGESFILEGSADATVFELYIEQILAPSLQAGQIVILDNLSTHSGENVRQVIEALGCQLLFLPSYSPDLSPIEEAFDPPQSLFAPGRSTSSRGITRSHRTSAPHDHPTGCLWLVYPLWISVVGTGERRVEDHEQCYESFSNGDPSLLGHSCEHPPKRLFRKCSQESQLKERHSFFT